MVNCLVPHLQSSSFVLSGLQHCYVQFFGLWRLAVGFSALCLPFLRSRHATLPFPSLTRNPSRTRSLCNADVDRPRLDLFSLGRKRPG